MQKVAKRINSMRLGAEFAEPFLCSKISPLSSVSFYTAGSDIPLSLRYRSRA